MRMKINKFLDRIEPPDRGSELDSGVLNALFLKHECKAINFVHSDQSSLSADKRTFAKGFLGTVYNLLLLLEAENPEALEELKGLEASHFEDCFSDLLYNIDDLMAKYPKLSAKTRELGDSFGEGVKIGYFIIEKGLRRHTIMAERRDPSIPDSDAVPLDQQPDESFFLKEASKRSKVNAASIEKQIEKEEKELSKMSTNLDRFKAVQKRHTPAKAEDNTVTPEDLVAMLQGAVVTETANLEEAEDGITLLWTLKSNTTLIDLLKDIKAYNIPLVPDNLFLGYNEEGFACIYILF